jgi:hypothetical protein
MEQIWKQNSRNQVLESTACDLVRRSRKLDDPWTWSCELPYDEPNFGRKERELRECSTCRCQWDNGLAGYAFEAYCRALNGLLASRDKNATWTTS